MTEPSSPHSDSSSIAASDASSRYSWRTEHEPWTLSGLNDSLPRCGTQALGDIFELESPDDAGVQVPAEIARMIAKHTEPAQEESALETAPPSVKPPPKALKPPVRSKKASASGGRKFDEETLLFDKYVSAIGPFQSLHELDPGVIPPVAADISCTTKQGELHALPAPNIPDKYYESTERRAIRTLAAATARPAMKWAERTAATAGNAGTS